MSPMSPIGPIILTPKKTTMKRLLIILAVALVALPMAAKKKQVKQQTDREYWCEQAYKMAQPVLENMAKGELQKNMKVEVSPNWTAATRKWPTWRPSDV